MIGIIGRLKQNMIYCGLPLILASLIILNIGRKSGIILLLHMLLIVFGYIAAVNDVKTKKIPNRLILTMLAVWVAVGIPLLFLEMSRAVDLLIDSLLGFVLGGGLFLLVYLVGRKGIGGGDVKFMAAAGLYLGFYGIVPTIFYGSIFAGLTGIVLLLLKKIKRKDTIPLVPFLYGGILITVFLLS